MHVFMVLSVPFQPLSGLVLCMLDPTVVLWKLLLLQDAFKGQSLFLPCVVALRVLILMLHAFAVILGHFAAPMCSCHQIPLCMFFVRLPLEFDSHSLHLSFVSVVGSIVLV